MNNEIEKKSIQERVLKAIKSGQVKMRPKWHFILKSILAAIGGIILVLTLLFLASFILFILRQTGVLFVPIFGFEGWYAFLVSLPWLLILLLLIFVVILEVLVRRYSFAYRRPLLYSAIGIMLIVIIGGYIVAATPLHSRLFREAERNGLPFTGQFYREFGLHRFRDVHLGTITEITDDGFLIQNRRSETLRVIITTETRFPLGTDFAQNDTVVVFGKRDDSSTTLTINGAVHALGIRKVDEEFDSDMPRPGLRKPFGPPLFRESP